MRPLLPLLAFALAVSVSAGEPPEKPARKPQNLRQRVCAEGAYLRGPRAGAAQLAGAERVEGGTQGGAQNAPDSGLFRFTPPKEGCEEAVESFFSGAGSGFEISPRFETDASGARRELQPEEASRRMVRLASLNRVATGDANLADRFFENRLNRGDVTALAGLDAERGLAQAPGTMSYFVSDGQPRVPFTFTPRPRRTGVASDTVPGPREPGPLPASQPWSVPESQRPPESYGPVRQWFNDLRAETADYFRGSPINTWEGNNRILPSVPHPDFPPGSPNTVGFVRLPNAPGLRHACEPGCYGTPKMMQLLAGMGAQFAQYFPGQAMSVGGISKPQGGPFPPHVSHQVGLDADISFAGGARSFDVQRNTLIVASVVRQLPDFHKINGRQYILVDASKHGSLAWGLDRLVQEGNLTGEQRDRAVRALTHWPHHNDHFHIRILP